MKYLKDDRQVEYVSTTSQTKGQPHLIRCKLTTSWIDGHAHLIIDRCQPQPKVWIKDLLSNQFKPARK